jgi:hypothetical protein
MDSDVASHLRKLRRGVFWLGIAAWLGIFGFLLLVLSADVLGLPNSIVALVVAPPFAVSLATLVIGLRTLWEPGH